MRATAADQVPGGDVQGHSAAGHRRGGNGGGGRSSREAEGRQTELHRRRDTRVGAARGSPAGHRPPHDAHDGMVLGCGGVWNSNVPGDASALSLSSSRIFTGLVRLLCLISFSVSQVPVCRLTHHSVVPFLPKTGNSPSPKQVLLTWPSGLLVPLTPRSQP